MNVRLSQQSAHSRHFFAGQRLSPAAVGSANGFTGISRQQTMAQVNMDRLFDADLMFSTGMTGKPRNRALQPHAGPRKYSNSNSFGGSRRWPLYVAGAFVAGVAIFMLISVLLP